MLGESGSGGCSAGDTSRAHLPEYPDFLPPFSALCRRSLPYWLNADVVSIENVEYQHISKRGTPTRKVGDNPIIGGESSSTYYIKMIPRYSLKAYYALLQIEKKKITSTNCLQIWKENHFDFPFKK